METKTTNAENSLLLHICCAGCGAYIIQELKAIYNIALFFYNPNIYPEAEWKKRAQDAEYIAGIFQVPIIIPEQSHNNWLKYIHGYENYPEGGERCRLCFQNRLEKTAQEANHKNYQTFATTLTISPHKNAEVINKIGNQLMEEYRISFLDKDFKKRDGFKRSVELSRKLNLYRQNYCGCEFSIR